MSSEGLHPAELQLRYLELQLVRLGGLLRVRNGSPAPTGEELDSHQRATSDLLAAVEASGIPLEAMRLAARFELSALELDTLFLAVGTAVDPDFRALIGASTRSGQAVVRAGLALALFFSSVAERRVAAPLLGCNGRLVRSGLLRAPTSIGLMAELVPTRRAIAILSGVGLLDDLPPFARLRTAHGSTARFDEDPAQLAQVLVAVEESRLVLLFGAPRSGRTTLARAICERAGGRFLEIDLRDRATAEQAAEQIRIVEELVMDAALEGLPVLIDHAEARLEPGAPLAAALLRALEGGGAAVVLVAGNEPERVDASLLASATLRHRVGLPGPVVRSTLWRENLRAAHPASEVALVGSEFQLTPQQIQSAAHLVNTSGKSLAAAAMQQLGGRSSLVKLANARAGKQSLILPEETRAEIDEIIAAIRARAVLISRGELAARRSRERGISALFDGESGTGKTLSCEIIALEVGLPLWRVNAATLVDKYIGETGKNLERVFEQARAEGCILLFDEADAIFGGRVDVARSTDRYANLETNILLQLMEEHSGVVFLTSNLKRGIDAAFFRRITFKVFFPNPDEELRVQLWDACLPAETVADDVDRQELARAFPLTGGGINNAVSRASYRAAAAERKISMLDLVECSQLECESIGKVVSVPLSTGT